MPSALRRRRQAAEAEKVRRARFKFLKQRGVRFPRREGRRHIFYFPHTSFTELLDGPLCQTRRLSGWPKVERVLQLIDAVEVLGIDPADVAPDH